MLIFIIFMIAIRHQIFLWEINSRRMGSVENVTRMADRSSHRVLMDKPQARANLKDLRVNERKLLKRKLKREN
jgi:hypothetical protein